MTRLRPLAPLALLMLGACAATPFQTPYEAGKIQLNRDEPHLALASFRTAAGMEGRTLRVLNALGASYDAMGRPDMAEIYYREALAQSPKDVQTLNNLGWSLMLRNRLEEAAAMLRLASENAPDNEVVARNLDMAEARLAETEPAAPPSEPAPDPAPRHFTPGPPVRLGPWIERTARGVQTLRTDFAAFDGALDAPPALVVPAIARPITPPPPQSCAVEIANGNGRTGAAARMRQALTPGGVSVARLINADSFSIQRTEIRFAPHCADQAQMLAAMLPMKVDLVPDRTGSVRLVLGRDLPHSKTRTTGI